MLLEHHRLPTTYLTSAFALLTRRPACTVCLYGALRLALEPYEKRRDALISILSEPIAVWTFHELQGRGLLTPKLAVTEQGEDVLRRLEGEGLPLPPEDLYEVAMAPSEPGEHVSHTSTADEPESPIRFSPREDDAWGEFIREEYGNLRRIALVIVNDSDDADEVAEKALIIAGRKMDAWEGTKESLRPWLRRIVVNQARDVIRRKSVRRQVEANLNRGLSGDDAWRSALNETQLSRIRAYEALNEVIIRLSELERQAFMFRYVAELSARDIAEILDTTPLAVRNWLSSVGRLVPAGDAQKSA